MLSLIKI